MTRLLFPWFGRHTCEAHGRSHQHLSTLRAGLLTPGTSGMGQRRAYEKGFKTNIGGNVAVLAQFHSDTGLRMHIRMGQLDMGYDRPGERRGGGGIHGRVRVGRGGESRRMLCLSALYEDCALFALWVPGLCIGQVGAGGSRLFAVVAGLSWAEQHDITVLMLFCISGVLLLWFAGKRSKTGVFSLLFTIALVVL